MSATPQHNRAGPASLPTASKVNVAAMLTAIVGIVIQIAAGVDYPPIPPGPIILAVAAALVVFTHRRWASIIAVIVPLFLTVGGTIAFVASDDMALRHPDDVAAFGATAVQMVAVIVAAIAGAAALRQRRG
jgi:hypothetical protein